MAFIISSISKVLRNEAYSIRYGFNLNVKRGMKKSCNKLLVKSKPSHILSRCNFKTSVINDARMNLSGLRPAAKPSRLILFGFIIGGTLSLSYVYDYYKGKKNSLAITNVMSENEYILQEVIPSHPVSRSINSALDPSGLKLTIYQFQTCPFCCKVRAFLDYYGFSYDVVEVNSITRSQTKWSNYRKVPFLIIEQDAGNKELVFQLKDSSMIISALQSLMSDKDGQLETIVKGFPIMQYRDDSGKVKSDTLNKYAIQYGSSKSPKKDEILLERKWREWTDDVYVHVLSPNIYRTMNESFQAFTWFSKAGQWDELFSATERFMINYIGAIAMYFVGKSLKRKYRIEDARQSLYDESNAFLKLTKKRKFIGGVEPNLADLNIYGVLSAIEGCDAFKDLIKNVDIENWYYSVKEEVENHNGNKYLQNRFKTS